MVPMRRKDMYRLRNKARRSFAAVSHYFMPLLHQARFVSNKRHVRSFINRSAKTTSAPKIIHWFNADDAFPLETSAYKKSRTECGFFTTQGNDYSPRYDLHCRSSHFARNTFPLSHTILYTSTGPFRVTRLAPLPPLQPCCAAIFSTVTDETLI